MPTIPKIIHQIWIGDKAPPQAMMDSCRDMNPGWEYQLWTESNLPTDFINRHHIREMARHQHHYPAAGQTDIMRYEILHRFGGFFIDADSEFIRPLDDFLIQNDSFCCYESESRRGDLLANGYLAGTRHNRLMQILIDELANKKTVVDGMPWQTTGPLFLTETVRKHGYGELTIYPSHYFIPRHFSSDELYSGPEKVYCIQHWGSTIDNERDKQRRAQACNQAGEALYGQGRGEAARRQFLQATTLYPNFIEAHNNLAVLSWEAGDHQQALTHLGAALKIDPANADARANLDAIRRALAG